MHSTLRLISLRCTELGTAILLQLFPTRRKKKPELRGALLDTRTGARAVPARSTSLGRGVLEHSGVFTPATLLRTGTVRGPEVAVSRCGRGDEIFFYHI
jgi:hypothetical protein